MNLALEVFWVFFRISWLSFGGVFGTLPQLEKWIVADHNWITHQQFIEAYVIGSVLPGPNMAMCPLIGFQVAGWMGFVAAFVGIYSAPALLMFGTYRVYSRNREIKWVRKIELSLRPLVFGLLTAAGIRFFLSLSPTNDVKVLGFGLITSVGMFVLYWKKKIGPLTVVFSSGFLWVLWQFLST